MNKKASDNMNFGRMSILCVVVMAGCDFSSSNVASHDGRKKAGHEVVTFLVTGMNKEHKIL